VQDVTKKGAVIIGGSGGLGRALVRALHDQGWRVAFSHCTSCCSARTLADELRPDVFTVRADITKPAEVSAVAEEIRQQWGKVQALVNCGGTVRDALLLKQTEEEWDAVVSTNLKGIFFTMRAFVPLMSSGGHIVNVTSLSGLRGRRGQVAYSAAKAALTGLTICAARELAAQDLRVNAVAPGYMATDMGTRAPEAMRTAQDESLLSVLCDPADVARFIVYLLSTRSVTGQLFCLDSRVV
jgi:3-oxoacyl-[acyl-carrier protein] reductase